MENVVDGVQRIDRHFLVAQNITVKVANVRFTDILDFHVPNRITNKAIVHVHIVGERMFADSDFILTPKCKHIVYSDIAFNSTDSIGKVVPNFILFFAQPLQSCIIDCMALPIFGSPAEHIKSIIFALYLTIFKDTTTRIFSSSNRHSNYSFLKKGALHNEVYHSVRLLSITNFA